MQMSSGSFAIVASRYNARYVDSMLRAAKAELWRADVSRIQIVRVPGAYEIPVVAKSLARRSTLNSPFSAIICLGVILRGETVHAAHIGEAVSRALMEIQLRARNPRHPRSAAVGKRGAGARSLPGPHAQSRHGSGAGRAGDGAGDEKPEQRKRRVNFQRCPIFHFC